MDKIDPKLEDTPEEYKDISKNENHEMSINDDHVDDISVNNDHTHDIPTKIVDEVTNNDENYNSEIINGDVLDDLAKSDIHSVHEMELSPEELIRLIKESEEASEKANTLKRRAEKAKQKMATLNN